MSQNPNGNIMEARIVHMVRCISMSRHQMDIRWRKTEPGTKCSIRMGCGNRRKHVLRLIFPSFDGMLESQGKKVWTYIGLHNTMIM